MRHIMFGYRLGGMNAIFVTPLTQSAPEAGRNDGPQPLQGWDFLISAEFLGTLIAAKIYTLKGLKG